MEINIDRNRVFLELSERFSELEKNGKSGQSLLFGINNLGVFKNGSVKDGETLLRIFNEDEWKKELTIYCSSGITVRAMELFKGEITSVVYFPELGEEPYELRYYALDWSNNMSTVATENTETDPRTNILPKILSKFDCVESILYMYVELKPLRSVDWVPCCVCGIKRAEAIPCAWNEKLAFCSQACQSVAWSQKTYDEKTSSGGDTDSEYVKIECDSDEMKLLKKHIDSMQIE